jgi:hypothetical protein
LADFLRGVAHDVGLPLRFTTARSLAEISLFNFGNSDAKALVIGGE